MPKEWQREQGRRDTECVREQDWGVGGGDREVSAIRAAERGHCPAASL